MAAYQNPLEGKPCPPAWTAGLHNLAQALLPTLLLLHPLPLRGSLCLHGPSLDLFLKPFLSWHAHGRSPAGCAQRWSRVLCLFPSTTPGSGCMVSKGTMCAVSLGAHCAQHQSFTELINPQVWKDAFSVTDSSAPRADDPDILLGISDSFFSISENFHIVSSCGDIIPHHS